MKTIIPTFIFTILLSLPTFAMIPAIVVTDSNSNTATIVNENDSKLEQMEGKLLSYLGNETGVIELFTRIVNANTDNTGLVVIDSEFNESTKTISLTVKNQGSGGFYDVSYWILTYLGE